MIDALLANGHEIPEILRAWHTGGVVRYWDDDRNVNRVLLAEVIRQDIERNLLSYIGAEIEDETPIYRIVLMLRQLSWPFYSVDGVPREPIYLLQVIYDLGVREKEILLPFFFYSIRGTLDPFFLVFSGLYRTDLFEYTPFDVVMHCLSDRQRLTQLQDNEMVGNVVETRLQLNACLLILGRRGMNAGTLNQEIGRAEERLARNRLLVGRAGEGLAGIQDLANIVGSYNQPREVNESTFVYDKVYDDGQVWERRVERYYALRNEWSFNQYERFLFANNAVWMIREGVEWGDRNAGLFCGLM
jgi:hypothetical protein